MPEIIMVYITMPSEEKAKEIAKKLLELRLIACATMLPCQSMYWWNGIVQDDQEFIMFVKTTEDAFEVLKQEIIKIHSYEIPCIIKIPVTANVPYVHWIYEQVNFSK